MLLNVSNDYLYTDTEILPIRDFHEPYFLCLGGDREHKVLELVLQDGSEEFSGITGLGDVLRYKSFSRPGNDLNAFKVFTQESRMVPGISDDLFFKLGLFTAEHDIPYIHRAASDLAAEGKWILDTNGKNEKLRVLCYDIETPSFESQGESSSIEIIGFTEFDIAFSSHKDLDTEEFTFDIQDINGSWETDYITQYQARGGEGEIEAIMEFVDRVKDVHIISGHNIISFDNHQIHNRIKGYINGKEGVISEQEKIKLNDFIERYTRHENIFHFGKKSTGIQFSPISLDTYHAALRFYRFLDSFTLKNLSRFLGIHIDNREYIDIGSMQEADWDRLMLYNRHDVMEQAGVTRIMLQQTLPLAFSTGMPIELLLPAGSTKVWDYMTMIRGAKHRKVIPPTCRAHGVSAGILRLLREEGIGDVNQIDVKREMVDLARKRGYHEDYSFDKEMIRVVKYGDEMPDWVNYPYIAFNSRRGQKTKGNENIGYHLPGGMTIQPSDVHSDFIPWWHMIVADVGAMYPTILKGMNACADSVGLARQGQKPDDWVWLKQISEEFLDRKDVIFRTVEEIHSGDYGDDDPIINDGQRVDMGEYADKGYFIGIKIAKDQGLVNMAMTGILNLIFRIKDDLKARNARGEDTTSLKMMYQSLKGMRNAGTHGILVASNVSCRQFNLWGGAEITTTGQRMLYDAMQELEGKNMRVVYGDTDGIYVACARSSLGIPGVCKAFKVEAGKGDYIIDPEYVLAEIELLNKRWREKLNYSAFELEAEYSDAMLFVKHKNYLIWNARNGLLNMTTKGNNFKGSDKAPIARKTLEDIMFRVLKDHQSWREEIKVQDSIRRSIKKHTLEIVEHIDLTKVKLEDLIMVQTVRPSGAYKNQDGSGHTHAQRSEALEKLLGKQITSSSKFRFVVTKMPLPGIEKPLKSGVKPKDYMYPLEALTDLSNIDLDWYRDMIMNYVKGAFGLHELEKTVQRGLHEFM